MLNTIMGIKPLSLLEVASTRVIREATQWSRMHGGAAEQPYWFFQGLRHDGLLMIASPGGHSEAIEALDVMNVIPMEPIRVLAMPPRRFALARTLKPGSPELYAPACVLNAVRTRYDFEYRVLFDDDSLNESSSWLAPLAAGERARLAPLTRRTRMPVSSMSSANWSADGYPNKIERRHVKACRLFFSKALSQPAAAEAPHG